MPTFTRRRLCSMLSDLSRHLTRKKFNDFSARLESSDTKAALAAEAELSVVWAISRVAHIDCEPVLLKKNMKQSRPELASNDLFRSGPAVVEVRALSDENFSGEEDMSRTANIIENYANRCRKRCGDRLSFEFQERSYWTTRYHRERCVDPKFKLTDETERQIREWVTASDWPNPQAIRIRDERTDVVIRWRESPGKLSKTFCSMPPLAYDLEDNPIYKALKSKSGQVSGAAAGTVRCIVLVDAGCHLLRHLRARPGAIHEVSGDAIINHALRKRSIDVVIVLSPFRSQSHVGSPQRSELVWNVTCFDKRKNIPEGEYDRIEVMAAQLPRPRLEGYQARALHQQGVFERGRRRRYRPTATAQLGEKMTIKVSAALLHDYLAGRIDAEKFRSNAFPDGVNVFELELVRGNVIRKATFEPGGIDEDDDYVVFDLDTD